MSHMFREPVVECRLETIKNHPTGGSGNGIAYSYARKGERKNTGSVGSLRCGRHLRDLTAIGKRKR